VKESKMEWKRVTSAEKMVMLDLTMCGMYIPVIGIEIVHGRRIDIEAA
jgi:hypothetical protein